MGHIAVAGLDGRQSQKCLEQFEVWTAPLASHPDRVHIYELLGYYRRAFKILLLDDYGPNPDVILAEWDELVEKIKEVTDRHFEGKPMKTTKTGNFIGFGCNCSSDWGRGGFHHAFNSETGIKLCTGRPMLRRTHGYYEHCTLSHLGVQMRLFGPPIKLSSWVLEAANKLWKEILESKVSWKWINKLHEDSEYHPAKQALKRYLRLVHPSRKQFSMREKRMRDVYRCGCCKLIKEGGHTRRNPLCKIYFDKKT